MHFITIILIFFHSYHVGLTQVEYDISEMAYQISIRIFTDDLENALKNKSGELVDILDSEVHDKTDMVMVEYIFENFEIASGDTSIPLSYLGSEKDPDVTWIYLETGKIDKADVLHIKNVILFEIFDDQNHIVNYSQNGDFKSRLIHKDLNTATFESW